MEKLVYLLRTNGDGDALREALLGESVPALRGEGARRLTVGVSDGAVTREGAPRIAQLDPKIAAEVCFWLENSDDRAGCEAILGAKAEALEGYLALESVPIVSEERLRCDGRLSRTPANACNTDRPRHNPRGQCISNLHQSTVRWTTRSTDFQRRR